ncbi:hypothetical protein K439DRAFT_1542732 [Ramaria rubella]|nr:hypothetical protein K439DRAFT_1542732 [Ramaria rubella]
MWRKLEMQCLMKAHDTQQELLPFPPGMHTLGTKRVSGVLQSDKASGQCFACFMREGPVGRANPYSIGEVGCLGEGVMVKSASRGDAWELSWGCWGIPLGMWGMWGDVGEGGVVLLSPWWPSSWLSSWGVAILHIPARVSTLMHENPHTWVVAGAGGGSLREVEVGWCEDMGLSAVVVERGVARRSHRGGGRMHLHIRACGGCTAAVGVRRSVRVIVYGRVAVGMVWQYGDAYELRGDSVGPWWCQSMWAMAWGDVGDHTAMGMSLRRCSARGAGGGVPLGPAGLAGLGTVAWWRWRCRGGCGWRHCWSAHAVGSVGIGLDWGAAHAVAPPMWCRAVGGSGAGAIMGVVVSASLSNGIGGVLAFSASTASIPQAQLQCPVFSVVSPFVAVLGSMSLELECVSAPSWSLVSIGMFSLRRTA